MDAIPVLRIAWPLLFRLSPDVDEPGWFSRITAVVARAVGVARETLAWESLSRSAHGVLRGLHLSRGDGEAEPVPRSYGRTGREHHPSEDVTIAYHEPGPYIPGFSWLRQCRHLTASHHRSLRRPGSLS